MLSARIVSVQPAPPNQPKQLTTRVIVAPLLSVLAEGQTGLDSQEQEVVRWAPGLGPRVTIARFDGGIHDLTLSGKEVRAVVFRELARWVDAFLPAPGTPEISVPPPPEDRTDDKSEATA